MAVTNQGAYWPVERIFGEGQLVSLPGGTPTEVAIDASETSRISKCQDLAYRAFKAVGGSCYGRVDMRYAYEHLQLEMTSNTAIERT